MIRINLLPFRAARKKEDVRRQLSLFFLALVLIVVGMGIAVARIDSRVKQSTTHLANLKSELSQLKKKQRQVTAIQKELQLLQKKLDVMSSLETGRRAPVEMFERLTETVVGKRMWLRSFTVNKADVKISGVALDDKTVAVFMKNLQGTGLFTSVNLQSVKQEQRGGVSLRIFSLDCPRKTLIGDDASKGGKRS